MPGIGTRSHGRRHNLSSITDKGKTKSDATACCARREEVLSMRANHFWPMPGRKIARRTTAAMATGRSGIATLRKEPMQVAPGSAIIGEESTAKRQISAREKRRDDGTEGTRSAFDFDFSFALFGFGRSGCGSRSGCASHGSLRQVGQLEAQVAGVGGETHAGFEIDEAFANVLLNDAVEMLHAVGVAIAHGVEQRFAFAFALFHVIASAHGGFQDLDGGDAALAILAGD